MENTIMTSNRWEAVIETQSWGHYSVQQTCGHTHLTQETAERCTDRWERREERINRPNREAGLSVSNSARFVTRKIS